MKSFDKGLRTLRRAMLISLALFSGCGSDANNPQAQPDKVENPLGQQENTPRPALPAHLVRPPSDPRAAASEALLAGLFDHNGSANTKLRDLLRVAGVPEASQVLVFSKTSLQASLITPTHPRAIYFNDDCYIGYVPGGLIEFGDADADPVVGSGLFAIDPRKQHDARLTTDGNCAICHDGSRTNNRPGFLVRSVFPDETGFPITSAGSTLVGHDTPIEKRWGGWYVTGTSENTTHRGNQTASEQPNGDADLDPSLGTNITDLSPYFNTARYLQPTSDIVALMVLEHQVQMHNLLTQGSTAVHEQTERSRSLAQHLGETFEPSASETLQRVIQSNARRIVEHLLFSEEIKLPGPVVGDPAFQQAFRANRREDRQGRSLKDFDLQTRMFKHRCSYMVYSRAFDLMHELLKEAVKQKLLAVLDGTDQDEDYAHLGAEERSTILTILRETGVL